MVFDYNRGRALEMSTRLYASGIVVCRGVRLNSCRNVFVYFFWIYLWHPWLSIMRACARQSLFVCFCEAACCPYHWSCHNFQWGEEEGCFAVLLVKWRQGLVLFKANQPPNNLMMVKKVLLRFIPYLQVYTVMYGMCFCVVYRGPYFLYQIHNRGLDLN